MNEEDEKKEKIIDLTTLVDIQSGPVSLVNKDLLKQNDGEPLESFLKDVKFALQRHPEKLVVYFSNPVDSKYRAEIYMPIEDFEKPYSHYIWEQFTD